MLSCNNEQKQDQNQKTEFLSATEISALDLNGQVVRFNVGYSVNYDNTKIKNCGLNNEEEVNDVLVLPCIRSVIRSEISKITENEIDKINRENLKSKINILLEPENLFLNGKSLDKCKVSLRLFSITKRE